MKAGGTGLNLPLGTHVRKTSLEVFFQEIEHLFGDKAAKDGKNDVTMRGGRFIHRRWDKNITNVNEGAQLYQNEDYSADFGVCGCCALLKKEREQTSRDNDDSDGDDNFDESYLVFHVSESAPTGAPESYLLCRRVESR